MMHKNEVSNLTKRKVVVEQMWLHYYNNTLFQKGVITETERNRMKNLINCRKHPTV